jgi:hypothetical protein
MLKKMKINPRDNFYFLILTGKSGDFVVLEG